MKAHESFTLELLRMRFTEEAAEVPESLDTEAFFELLKAHEIGPLVYGPLKRLDVPEAWLAYPREAYYKAAQVNTQQNALFEGVRKRLDAEGIRHLLVKGIVLEWFYHPAFVRTKGDIDMLIEEADLPRVDRVLRDLGFTRDSTGEAHDVYKRYPLLLEVHKRLFPSGEGKVAQAFDEPWADAGQHEGAAFMFTREAHAAYLLAHTAKHFKSAGAGLRMLLDLAVLLNQEDFKQAVFLGKVREMGLERFHDSIRTLLKNLFNIPHPGEHIDSETTDALLAHVMKSGTFGLQDVSQIETVRTARTGRLRYYLGKVFLPYRSLKHRYPLLKGRPLLYPFVLAYRNGKLCLSPRMRRRVFAKRSQAEREGIRRLHEIIGLLDD